MTFALPGGSPNDPRRVPEIRGGLLDMAEHGGVWEQTEVTTMMRALQSDSQGYGRDEIQNVINNTVRAAQNQVDWYRQHLPAAQCIYITSDLLDVIEAAAESIPEDHTLTREDIPAPAGFVVFERPIIGRGVDLDEEGKRIMVDMRLDGVSWGEVKLPAYDADITQPDALIQTGRDGMGMAAYRFLERGQHDKLSEALDRDPGMAPIVNEQGWVPLGRTDWLYDDALARATHTDIEDMVQETMLDDRRLLLSIWALIQQKRVVQSTAVPAQRHVRRRLARQGHQAPDVTVVHLRRPEYTPRHDDGTTDRKIGVRFMVRPHWRHQACGPGRMMRRLILVPPHIKGPVDAPMTHGERVWSLDR